ncbi:hypothetical protein CKM354_000626900 [Cercospora kikuchii]|uniref:Heterokaryon incompatibility domain-containing protein n=1 Tax=Cercospora kikuchii TaxID=84275 RepID=A0A9P3CHL1_9PEZI|nr:uncharacterized protein CKM354_000626900 [Cercospora kikuchii]GIZ43024.1 hypothetical protein CKM354_000626900 [Cercospora kikuchii]
MWLLNARTRCLENFFDDRQMYVKYAILSHTWGKDEVGFDDIHQDRAKSMAGYRKIDFTCEQALKDGIEHVWVDTCCIDKRSSAELSEAINSMYRWYYNAQVCYAFLEDYLPPEGTAPDRRISMILDDERVQEKLIGCSWFTRGWTLQELIAPATVRFYDGGWNFIGTKWQCMSPLIRITGIPKEVLVNREQLSTTSIAQRMSWASRRTTSRLEDQAYCLLGLFDVNMPLLYGEGSKAFVRLQEEIIQARSWEDQDHSIFAFQSWDGRLLADSPKCFDGCNDLLTTTLAGESAFELSKRGLPISLLGAAIPSEDQNPNDANGAMNDLVVMLNCTKDSGETRIALHLRARPQVDMSGHPRLDIGREELVYDRMSSLDAVLRTDLENYRRMDVMIARRAFVWPTISRQLVIKCAGASFHTDAFEGRDDSQRKDLETWGSRHRRRRSNRGLASEVETDSNTVTMGSRNDGKLFAIFTLEYTTTSGEPDSITIHESVEAFYDERPSIVVQVEADARSAPPSISACCSDTTRFIASREAQSKLLPLRIGISRSFRVNSGNYLHIKAGLGFETGQGILHLNVTRTKTKACSPPKVGIETEHSNHRDLWQAASPSHVSESHLAASKLASNAVEGQAVRALQRELSDLRDEVRSLYKRFPRDHQALTRSLEKE